MDPNTAVTGEENIYFEMESTAIADGYDVVQATASERCYGVDYRDEQDMSRVQGLRNLRRQRPKLEDGEILDLFVSTRKVR